MIEIKKYNLLPLLWIVLVIHILALGAIRIGTKDLRQNIYKTITR